MILVGYGTATEDRISGSLLSYYLPREGKESDISNSNKLRKNDWLFGIRTLACRFDTNPFHGEAPANPI
jgi:hypothetical protein